MAGTDFAAQERIIQEIDRQGRESSERVRTMLRENGRPDLVVELDARLRDVANGVQGARAIWHGLSDVQRELLEHLVKKTGSARLVAVQGRHQGYDVETPGVPLPKRVGVSTVRSLAARDLLDWDGGAFDPESAALANERTRFVVRHGPS